MHLITVSKNIKQNLKQLPSETNSVTVGTFNPPLSIIYKIKRQKIGKDTVYLNKNINQLDLTDMYSTCHLI